MPRKLNIFYWIGLINYDIIKIREKVREDYFMKVTINDVAREAGVSKATVSRVLSNNERISEETRLKVKEVIERLGYKPNVMARNLARNQTKTIGVILPMDASVSFGNPIFIQMMQGISMYAQEKHYFLMYAFGKEKEEERNIDEFSQNGIVDGIIILKSEVNDKTIKKLRESGFPFVVIGRPGRETSVLWVDNDNFGATYEIAEAMIKKGHKKIAFVGAKQKWTVSKDRLEGYKRALEVHNISYEEKLVYHGEAFNEQTGKEAMDLLIKESPTAIIATDDLIAVGVNDYLNRIGGEVKALVGFNNTMLAAYQKPALASVEIYGERLGYAAAKLLVEQLEGYIKDHMHAIIETKLIERESFN